jgi:hypothetical protein
MLGILGIFASGACAFSGATSTRTAHVAYPNPRSYYEAHVDLAQPERVRIQAHLAETEAVLRANPPAGLSDAQMKNRLARLDDLHEYWVRGEFPKNRDFPDRLIPYFIDAKGVPCAMGYLVIQSGAGDFAEEVHQRMNNAYIAEIAAADGRLAAWAKVQGMTLEETARVQPSYGPPRLSRVTQVVLDTLGHPWALGPDGNNILGRALFYRDSSQWKLYSVVVDQGFCLTRSGLPLLVGGAQVRWNARDYRFPKDFTSSCEWSANDSDAWVGSPLGVTRLRRGGSGDTLASTVIPSPRNTTDTVTGIATTPGFVWGISNQGVFRLNASATDSAPTVWDSVAVWGKRILRIKASGQRVWLGIGDGAPKYTDLFSTRGLRRYNGSGWSAFVASQSSIQTPGDTIYALAVRDTGSVWVATPFGFSRFNGTTTVKVADIPSGVTVYDMAGDATGFYAGTNQGVYRYDGTSLTFLGQPAMPIRGLRPAERRKSVSPTVRIEAGKTAPGTRTVLGRSSRPKSAAGVYVAPSKSP